MRTSTILADSAGVPVGHRGPSMRLQSGRMFPLLDPRPEDIRLADIAMSLSKLCRFGGHVVRFYSVAEHSVRVSRLLPEGLALWGLLHDAAEAYIGDVVRPVREALGEPRVALEVLEGRILKAVADRFGLPWPMPPEVRDADAVMLATEARDLMGVTEPWPGLPEPLPDRLDIRFLGDAAWGPGEAAKAFVARFGHAAGLSGFEVWNAVGDDDGATDHG